MEAFIAEMVLKALPVSVTANPLFWLGLVILLLAGSEIMALLPTKSGGYAHLVLNVAKGMLDRKVALPDTAGSNYEKDNGYPAAGNPASGTTQLKRNPMGGDDNQ